MERAVARQHDHAVVIAQGNLCANGRAVAKAHGTQAAAGQKAAAFGVVQVLGSPHLVLADIRYIHGLGAGLLTDLVDDLVGFQLGEAVLGW